MKPELEKKLYDRFAFLEQGKYLIDLGFRCGDGWSALLFQLCEQIELVLRADPELEPEGVPFHVEQVKEKSGGLRFYVTCANSEITTLISNAEDRSFQTCEECGNPGKVRGSSWLETRCDDCAEKPEQ